MTERAIFRDRERDAPSDGLRLGPVERDGLDVAAFERRALRRVAHCHAHAQAAQAGYASGVSDNVEKLLGRKPRIFAEFTRDYSAAWKPKA